MGVVPPRTQVGGWGPRPPQSLVMGPSLSQKYQLRYWLYNIVIFVILNNAFNVRS